MEIIENCEDKKLKQVFTSPNAAVYASPPYGCIDIYGYFGLPL